MTRMQIWGRFQIHPIAKPQLPPELLNSTNIPSGSHPKKSQVINMSRVMENEKMEKQKTKTIATPPPPNHSQKSLTRLCSHCAASGKLLFAQPVRNGTRAISLSYPHLLVLF